MFSVIDLVNMYYSVSKIYIVIKIQKKKNENKSNRLGKH